MDSNSWTGATMRFDGAGEGAARRYWKWRKWAGPPCTPRGRLRRRPLVALFSVFWMDPLSWLSRAFVSRISVSQTVQIGSFSCLDERFPDLETHDKIGESLDNVFCLRVDKGERTAAYTGRCRELFEKAAREETSGCTPGSGTQGYCFGGCGTVVYGAERCTYPVNRIPYLRVQLAALTLSDRRLPIRKNSRPVFSLLLFVFCSSRCPSFVICSGGFFSGDCLVPHAGSSWCLRHIG